MPSIPSTQSSLPEELELSKLDYSSILLESDLLPLLENDFDLNTSISQFLDQGKQYDLFLIGVSALNLFCQACFTGPSLSLDLLSSLSRFSEVRFLTF
jgi:hypothetical protein